MFNFDKKELLPVPTIVDVKRLVNSYDMFVYYLGNFKLGQPFSSPLLEDKKPSFSIFRSGDEFFFNDFRIGGGDIVKFVQLRFNISFKEAIHRIMIDAGLNDKFNCTGTNYTSSKKIIIHKNIPEAVKPDIRVKTRKWNDSDINFWKSFNISKNTIKKYNVYPISFIFINKLIIKADKLSFVFKEFKDNKPSYTIYQPYNKKQKWIKSHDSSVFYGWDQLPPKGDKLIITKSMKDIMTIDSIMNLPATALQSEKIEPKPQVIQELKNRFKNIYLLYDNDYINQNTGKTNFGRVFGKSIATKFDLFQIEIPDYFANTYEAKDISDWSKNGGIDLINMMLGEDIDKYII